ncbi:MAG: hypothetical protein H7177_15460 [Rhizobacter sp.]|nr:hypothetical protein [Bacteriovorax sp.]
MKSLLVVLALTLSVSAMANQTGMGPNGPWTVGPLGYTDPSVSLAGAGVSTAGSSVGSSVGNPTLGSSAGSLAAVNMKAIAVAVQNDAQNYLQTGEMSNLLGYEVNNILAQNSELSVEEAVTIVLQFAETHI